MKLIIDFNEIKTYTYLNVFLGDFLFSKDLIIKHKYGYNLAAFWDTYGYSKDEDLFEIH